MSVKLNNSAFLDNLIDWTGPIVESRSRPLIPLPSNVDLVPVIEDNPFDAIERQIIQNEDDFFNINSTPVSNELVVDNLTPVDNNLDKALKLATTAITQPQFDSDVKTRSDILDNTKIDHIDRGSCNDPELEPPDVSNHITDSQLKELILNRITTCIRQATTIPGISKCSDSSSQGSPSLKDSPILRRNFDLNKAFLTVHTIQHTPSINKENEVFIDISTQVDAITDCSQIAPEHSELTDDIMSIIPKWDEPLSSSDDEVEKIILSKSLPVKCDKTSKKTNSVVSNTKKQIFREPLVAFDPNAGKVKLYHVASKSGPMKALAPVTTSNKAVNEKAILNRRSSLVDKVKITTITSETKKRAGRPTATSTPQTRKPVLKTLNPKPKVLRNGRDRIPPRSQSPDSTTPFLSKSLSSVSRVSLTPVLTRKGTGFSANMVSSSTHLSSYRNLKNKENVPFKS